MRIGLQIPDFTWPGSPRSLGPDLARIARNAEASGISSVWVMDHFFQIRMVGPPEHEMLEAYTTLSHLAAVTERIRLGAMVTGVTYRHPGLLVKTVTTLDVLSGGRAWLGIGAAWNEEEHLGLGVPFPPLAERFEMLEETLQIALQMWSGDESPYAGRHYRLERPLNFPQARSTPHPPILIGGGGEKKTLRLVAQYADACNLYEMGHDKIAHKLGVLRGHCADAGRDYGEITRTTLGRLAISSDGHGKTQTVDQAVDRLGRLAELGIDEAIVSLSDVHETETFDLVSEVVDQVHRITPQGR
ncbi:LLM class F420-dependent oxidoreductase [Segeticoccus rhizosphaerae]|jgi:F420-dependent oxidoreductase-like protein|uniref:LLM class F420-dependent oxidoreductase n=1 Tax=Segeticoccus rhizosphaerae TaxID=1104777 RepID=UPI0010C04CC9|nr:MULTISPECIES: LLM class F420-dependent oxidoreductase [Intrasporangiaceae]